MRVCLDCAHSSVMGWSRWRLTSRLAHGAQLGLAWTLTALVHAFALGWRAGTDEGASRPAAEPSLAERLATGRAHIASNIVAVATEAWSQSRQLVAAEATDAFGILALNVAGIVGLGSIAAIRDWPPRWWWGLIPFGASSAICTVVPRVLSAAEGQPKLGGMYAQALTRLPDVDAALTVLADRIQALTAGNLGVVSRRRRFNGIALVIMVGGAVFEVLLFLKDFH